MVKSSKLLNVVFFHSFGTCCLFLASDCGSTIDQNQTYIRNPGFPSEYADTADCVYTITRMDNGIHAKLECMSYLVYVHTCVEPEN